ncbi:hypothetical protein CDD82_7663 [Ophiocordyceps australis]|uniref:Uncharacterized protein n=1 Tax=Ophiocordyceps australis TaxID=1399860 RepID=A0A2C5YPC3_9HYPO|nr:hypothetical protein CDD82_7663 [Ophiocordyceps australis]
MDHIQGNEYCYSIPAPFAPELCLHILSFYRLCPSSQARAVASVAGEPPQQLQSHLPTDLPLPQPRQGIPHSGYCRPPLPSMQIRQLTRRYSCPLPRTDSPTLGSISDSTSGGKPQDRSGPIYLPQEPRPPHPPPAGPPPRGPLPPLPARPVMSYFVFRLTYDYPGGPLHKIFVQTAFFGPVRGFYMCITGTPGTGMRFSETSGAEPEQAAPYPLQRQMLVATIAAHNLDRFRLLCRRTPPQVPSVPQHHRFKTTRRRIVSWVCQVPSPSMRYHQDWTHHAITRAITAGILHSGPRSPQ